MIGCSEGGTSIEDLAEKFPDKIIKIPVDIREGLTDNEVRQLVWFVDNSLCKQYFEDMNFIEVTGALRRLVLW